MNLQFPVDYIKLNQLFNGTHKGIDLAWKDNPNCNIYAPADGTVVALKNNYKTTDTSSRSYGNYIEIQHDNGISSLSAHLLYDSVLVKVGDKVKRGQKVAKMGNTGYSFGNHDHFEIRLNGTKVDPLKYVGYLETQEVNWDKTLASDRIKPFQEIKIGDYVDALEDIKLYTSIEHKESLYTFKKGNKAYIRFMKNNEVALADKNTHEYFTSAWTSELNKLLVSQQEETKQDIPITPIEENNSKNTVKTQNKGILELLIELIKKIIKLFKR